MTDMASNQADLKVFDEAKIGPNTFFFAEIPLRNDLKMFHEAKLDRWGRPKAHVFAEVPLRPDLKVFHIAKAQILGLDLKVFD